MKIDHHGQAKILSHSEISSLFTHGLITPRDRSLFGICLFTACRIREACTLRTVDTYDANGGVLPKLNIRKGNTKGKLATRTIPINSELRSLLSDYYPLCGRIYLFPGRFGSHIDPDSADKILRRALKRIGAIGVSTHSFRRTALTMMSNNGTPLRVIQEVSGHKNLGQLQRYIEVRDEQVTEALRGLSFLGRPE